MRSSQVWRQAGQPRGGAGGPAFDLLAAKLLRPHVRAETIRRSSLIDRLAKGDGRPVVSVVAPAGYGKTTLLSQWAEGNGHAFAWVSVDEKDNDPKVLLAYVAEALDAVEPVGERVFETLASPASSVPGSVVPRLVNAFSSMTVPVALVLDDVHLLDNSECRAALSALADHVPAGSRLVLAGRTHPPLRVARLRAEGRLLEIGPDDLSLTRDEAAALLRAAEVVMGDADVAELHRRTEGWPVGLYLAALYLREGGSLSGANASFGGDDRFVSEYVESEFLSRISRPQRVFLTRTAVLERLSGPLCEAVLDQPGSAATLAALARSNLLLVPLDRRGQWYRYHHLFRDMLLAELERLEPDLIPALQRRAADWSLRNGSAEEALEYFMAAGDLEQAADLVQGLWHRIYNRGRTSTLQRWFRWLADRGGIEGHPMVAIAASLLAAATGRPAEATRWAEVIERWQQENGIPLDDPYIEGWAALLWALLCRRGVDQMRADADEAARKLAAANLAIPVTALLQGLARVLSGDLEAGEAFFADAITLWEAGAPDSGAPHVIAETLSERSLVAMACNQWPQAEAFASRASAMLRQAGLEDPLVCAVRARLALHRGDAPALRRELTSALRLRSLFTSALPHLAVQTRIELVRVHVALADLAGARTLMREIDDLLRRCPGLGTLAGEAQALRAQLSRRRGLDAPGASALSAAELRLLPLLSTHLTFAEIGAELFLSLNTVKTQAISIYRKLGASTRSQAVARSRELGLLEG
jgi:LuxR family transcriptional regulator, maltose regulon positive regulatory protein